MSILQTLHIVTKRKLFASFISALFLLIGLKVIAQQKELVLVNHLDGDNLLEHNFVNALYFDNSTGLLWIATAGGLVKYDGITIKQFDARNLKYLGSPRITNICLTNKNEAVAFDLTHKAAKIVGNEVFEYNYKEKNNEESIRSRHIIELPAYNQQHTPFFDSISNVLSNDQICTYYYKSNKEEYFFSGNTMFVLGSSFKKIDINKNIKNYKIAIINNNVVLLGDAGFTYIFDKDANKFVQLKKNDQLISYKYSDILYDVFTKTTFLVVNKNVYTIGLKNNTLVFNNLGYAFEIPKNITSVTSTPNKNTLFFGTDGEGLYVFSKMNFKTYGLDTSIFNKYIQTSASVNVATPNELYAASVVDDSLVFACPSFTINLHTNKITPQSDTPKYVFSNVVDQNRIIYFSENYDYHTNDNINRYYFKNNILKKLSPIKLKYVCFYYDSVTNKIWVSTTDGGFGFLKDNKFVEFGNWDRSDRIDWISRTGGRFLLRTRKDIFELDVEHQKIIPFTIINKSLETQYKSKGFIRDLHFDEDGLLWIATYGYGIFMYSEHEKKLYRAKLDFRKNLLYGHSFIDDGNGNFYIPTNNGLYLINRKNLIAACKDSTENLFYYYFNKTNGLVCNEFNGGAIPSYNILKNGDILLPCLKGLVRVYANSFIEPIPYPIFIDNVETNITNHPFSDNLVFKSNERNITWFISTSHIGLPSSPSLFYQLDDDSSWKQLQIGENKIHLVDLKSGTHTLKIKNQYDMLGEKIAYFKTTFSIQKRYYETLPFIILMALLFALLTYLVTYFRTIQLAKKNTLLSDTVTTKTNELTYTISELENTISELDNSQSELIKMNRHNEMMSSVLAHDIRSPLRFLVLVSMQMHDKINALGNEDLKDLSQKSRVALQQVFGFTETFLMWAKIDKGNPLSLQKENIKIAEIVDEVKNYYAQLFVHRGNIFTAQIEPNLEIKSNLQMLSIILRNLIDNANKFTTNGKIIIEAFSQSNKKIIIVKDTGKNINMDFASQFLDSTQHASYNNNQGLGLIVIKELCGILNATLGISINDDGVGTKFEIIFSD